MAFVLLLGCVLAQNKNTATYPARLRPGQDLLIEVQRIARFYGLRAVNIVSAVGSVNGCFIRYANRSDSVFVNGPREIVALSGTLDQFQKPHIHIALGDAQGQVAGGHLEAQSGISCKVFTTIQLLLLQNSNVAYKRQLDNQTGYDQLYIYDRIAEA